MRAKRPLAVLVVLLALGLMPATAVLAMHAPQVEDVIQLAKAEGLSCTPDVGQVNCAGFGPNDTYRTATVYPASGPLDLLSTTVPAFQGRDLLYHMDSFDQSWNGKIHNVGCGDTTAVANYVASVAALGVLNTSVPDAKIGECTMSGRLSSGDIDFSPTYILSSQPLPSAFATPTPSPTPTPKPTASPTATPTPTASLTPTLSPTATPTSPASPTPTETATASASQSSTESLFESPSVDETGAPTPRATPEQSVAGLTFAPEPTPAPPGRAAGGRWADSIPAPADVSTDPGRMGVSALVAVALLLVMGFVGELFDNTLQNNYPRMMAWWQKSWIGRIGRSLGRLFGGGA